MDLTNSQGYQKLKALAQSFKDNRYSTLTLKELEQKKTLAIQFIEGLPDGMKKDEAKRRLALIQTEIDKKYDLNTSKVADELW